MWNSPNVVNRDKTRLCLNARLTIWSHSKLHMFSGCHSEGGILLCRPVVVVLSSDTSSIVILVWVDYWVICCSHSIVCIIQRSVLMWYCYGAVKSSTSSSPKKLKYFPLGEQVISGWIYRGRDSPVRMPVMGLKLALCVQSTITVCLQRACSRTA